MVLVPRWIFASLASVKVAVEVARCERTAPNADVVTAIPANALKASTSKPNGILINFDFAFILEIIRRFGKLDGYGPILNLAASADFSIRMGVPIRPYAGPVARSRAGIDPARATAPPALKIGRKFSTPTPY